MWQYTLGLITTYCKVISRQRIWKCWFVDGCGLAWPIQQCQHHPQTRGVGTQAATSQSHKRCSARSPLHNCPIQYLIYIRANTMIEVSFPSASKIYIKV